MCIAVKTYRCGAKEHLFHTDCKEENCSKYVSYVAAPGDCFHCVTRNDPKVLEKARALSFANSAMKAYAVYQEKPPNKAIIREQSDQINAGKRDGYGPETLLEKAQGAIPNLLDEVRKVFPDFDNPALAKPAAETKGDVKMVDGNVVTEPPADIGGAVMMQQDPQGGATVGPGKGESTPTKPISRMTRSSSQKSQTLQDRSPNISNPSSPRTSNKRVAKGSPDRNSGLRKTSKGNEDSKPGKHRKSLSAEERAKEEKDRKAAEAEMEIE